MKNKDISKIPSSSELRKMASDLRKMAAKVEEGKLIKSAKYIQGITALARLQEKLRSL